jgi:elongation factor 3
MSHTFSSYLHSPSRTGPEIWHVESGRLTHKGKAAITEDAPEKKTPRGSKLNTPQNLSRNLTPVGSTNATPAGSGAEDLGAAVSNSLGIPRKKKKLTRNQLKAQEERRRLRHIAWLTTGGPKPEDTDED